MSENTYTPCNELILAMHRATGFAILECKSALTESLGDALTAIEIVKKKTIVAVAGPKPPPEFWEQFK